MLSNIQNVIYNEETNEKLDEKITDKIIEDKKIKTDKSTSLESKNILEENEYLLQNICPKCDNNLTKTVKFILKNATEQEIREKLKENLPGLNIICILCILNNRGNESIYLPGISRFYNIGRDNYIRKNYNGFNIKALANEFNISERHARSILNPKENI